MSLQPVRPSVAACAAAAAAACAWISQSTLSFAAPEGPRIVLLPVGPAALVAAAAAGLGVFLLLRRGASIAALSPLVLVLLPLLPLTVPDVFLMWAGPIRLLVWLATAVLLVAGAAIPARTMIPSAVATLVRDRPALAAGLLSFALFGTAALIASPSVPGGDEPHYLVITQSLLLDGDLRIENNHARGDYQAYVAGPLRPHYIQRGRDGQIYSIHAPGISVLVLPAFAAGGYRLVVFFLVGAAALGAALLWHVAWLATRSPGAAWFGWGAATLSSTTIFHTFTVYPDGVGGLLVLTGIWALLRAADERRSGAERAWPWLLHGAALACLPWLHTRFAVLAGSLGALLLWRLATTRNPAPKAVAFLSVPAVSALCWVGYFIAIYGRPDPSAPYGSTREFSSAFVPGGLAGLLFDQRFGLLANSPVLLCAAAGFAAMLRRPPSAEGTEGPGSRRLALELFFVVAPYLVTASHYAMWWGGWSAPARFAAVVVPALAVACAAAWAAFRSPSFHRLASGALVATAFISAVLIVPGRGRLAFNTREGYALWLDWVSPVADLGRGLPVWFRDREPAFFLHLAVWIAVVGAGAAVVTVILTRRARSTSATAAALLVFACAAMLAVQLTWRVSGLAGRAVTPSQLELLRQLSSGRPALAFALNPFSRLDPPAIPARMRIEPGARYLSVGAGGRRDRPLLTLPAVPAGRYRVTPSARGAGGWLMIGIAQDQFALVTEPLASPPQSFDIEFPVDVRSLVVNGDEEARRAILRITVEPLAVVPAAARLTDDFARRAVRYGAATAFFMDEGSFPEPEAFWIRGARSSSVVLDPEAGSVVRLLLRNAPVDNRVRLTSGAWRQDLTLAPGEERIVEVPLDRPGGAALVKFESSAGFRPSDVEPGSRDQRYLGVWVSLAAE